MTPGARISAAIECLDLIFDGMPAEKALTGWARRSRFAGSKDRAAVRDHVFDVLRRRDTYAYIGGGLTGRSVIIGLVQFHDDLEFDALFNGVGHAPYELSEEEKARLSNTLSGEVNGAEGASNFWDLQDWCRDKLSSSHPQNARKISEALKSRAPVDVRVNLRRATVSQAQEQLHAEEIEAEACSLAPAALRLKQNARKIARSQTYLDGIIELQDAGSQALVGVLPLANCKTVLDYCAGGGGKSLTISDMSDAKVFAHDISVARMADISKRAERAGVTIPCLASEDLPKHAPFDLVLCDAPCSGSGSWRRSPDAKWRITPKKFNELLDLQFEILCEAQKLVAPMGYLVYATCSLFAEENEDQVRRLLEKHPNFERKSQHNWTPADGCDGFFVCVLQLKA